MKYTIQYIEDDGTEHEPVRYDTESDDQDVGNAVELLMRALMIEGDRLTVTMESR